MQNIFTTRNIIIAVVAVILIASVAWYLTLPKGTGGEGGISGFFSGLFPESGEVVTPPAPPPASGENTLPDGTEIKEGDSTKLVSESVSGAMFLKNKVRYIEKSSGHLYEIDSDGGNKTRLSNTTIPGIFEVAWSPLGNRAILKYSSSDSLTILSALFSGSSTITTFLPSEIRDVTFNPKGDRIAYVRVAGDEGSVITATPDNKSQTVRLKMPITSWKLFWPDANNIYLLTAPSAYLDGYLYKISLSTGAFTKVLGPVPGLSLSTNGTKALFSGSDAGGRTVFDSVLTLSGGAISSLQVKTLPEKCTWSKKLKDNLFCAVPLNFQAGIYPDDWYKGKISTSDALIKIDTKNPTLTSLLISGSLDAEKLFFSDDETLIFLTNKKDGSLWRVRAP